MKYAKQDKSYASVNRKSDKIIVKINIYKLELEYLKYALQHELTHIVCDYSEPDSMNLNSLKNTIFYDDDIFGLTNNCENFIELFEKIMRMLYWINKSEQDAMISATLKYVREKYNGQEIDYDKAISIIKETFFLNQLDMFGIDKDSIGKMDEISVYILGYYMQRHHYLYGKIYKETVLKAIESGEIDYKLVMRIKDAYYYRFNEYRKKLFNYILNICF